MNVLFQDIFQPNILRLMRSPLTLYALKKNGHMLIDLAGILERYAIIYITELFYRSCTRFVLSIRSDLFSLISIGAIQHSATRSDLSK